MAVVVSEESDTERENGNEHKIHDENNNNYYIYEDVFVHILSKLPLKDLHRCKCLSKECGRMISDISVQRIPLQTVSGLYFLTSKVTRYEQRIWEDSCKSAPFTYKGDFYLSFFSNLSDKRYVTDCASLANRRRLGMPNVADGGEVEWGQVKEEEFEGMSYLDILPFSPQGKDFIDCCNGLLLFLFAPACQFYVCNPATKQCVGIPPLNGYGGVRNAALAYNPLISPHFKIVHFHLESQPQWLDLFDSKTGEWFRVTVHVEAPSHEGQFGFFNRPVYFDGVLYMLSWYRKIYSFDLSNYSSSSKVVSIYPIDLPFLKEESHIKRLGRGCLGLSSGTLCYTYKAYPGLHLWILNNPQCSQAGGHEWILKYNVCTTDIPMRMTDDISHRKQGCLWMQPVAVAPNSDVVFLCSAFFILSYNMKTDVLEMLYEAGPGTLLPGLLYQPFPYTPSLVPLKLP